MKIVLKKLQGSIHNTVRNIVKNRSLPILNRICSFKFKDVSIISNLLTLTHKTKKFLRDNHNVIFTKANKGNIIVALDRDSYFDKVNYMLQDVSTYMKIDKNPLTNITNKLKNLLVKWKKSDCISQIIGI